MAKRKPRATTFDLRATGRSWQKLVAAEALNFSKADDKRCVECHGPVRGRHEIHC